MPVEQFDFTKRFSPKRKIEFAGILKSIQAEMDMKVSSRGWCYTMEQRGYINKNQFDRVADAINDLRRTGALPVDFVEEDEGRLFSCLPSPSNYDMKWLVKSNIEDVTDGYGHYQPAYWQDEEYFIQVIVEKVDVRNLFHPICERFDIPIANARGWSSILQRAQYARRFKQAEDDGKKCVLLYCGDHDPDGLRISDTLRQNLEQLKDITWRDGTDGYDPSELIIDRFGLEYDFIIKNKLTWIDNLITGNTNKKMDLSSTHHPNHNLPYVQKYLKKVGARKCEANALIVIPEVARQMFRDAINKYINLNRFQERRDALDSQAAADYNAELDKLHIDVSDIITDENTISVRDFINEVGNL